MARRVVIEIVGDSRSAERAFKRTSAAATSFQSKVGRQARAGGLGFFGVSPQVFGAAAVGLAMKKSIDVASDLNEQIGKTNVVFGQSSEQVQAWAQTTASAFGLSQRAALATASSFGALFAPLGIVGQEAAKQSQKLTELGADLASFYNTDVQSALDAIRSGLVGEAEPLRRYGVLLSETRVQQEALRETGKKHATQLTNQEKVLARINIIYQDSSKAQGDFARSQGRLAGQTKTLTANIEDLAATVGQFYIPMVTRALGATNDFFDALNKWAAPERALTRGSRLETSFVPKLAKQIDAMRKAGKGGREIEAALRARLGTSGVASDLIAAAFTFGRDPKLRARLAKQAKDAAKETVKQASVATDREIKGAATARAQQRNTWFDAMIGREADKAQDLPLRRRLQRMAEVVKLVQGRRAETEDPTRRLTLEDTIRQLLREQLSIKGQIADKEKAAAAEQQRQKQALAAREKAATAELQRQNRLLRERAQAIKSAVLEQLQRRQQGVENARALKDALEQLRIVRRLGGPKGIQLALRDVADARFGILAAGVEAARPSLRRQPGGGQQFGLAGVTINIHGVTDPDEVARKVAAVLERRRRHTTTTFRGPAAGTASANR